MGFPGKQNKRNDPPPTSLRRPKTQRPLALSRSLSLSFPLSFYTTTPFSRTHFFQPAIISPSTIFASCVLCSSALLDKANSSVHPQPRLSSCLSLVRVVHSGEPPIPPPSFCAPAPPPSHVHHHHRRRRWPCLAIIASPRFYWHPAVF